MVLGVVKSTITPQEVYDMVIYQIGALQGFLQTYGETMQHVKPHGALYNMAVKDSQLAEAIAKAVYDMSPNLILFGLASSAMTEAAEKIGVPAAHEVFADRTYQADGSLTPRRQSNALITDETQAVQQVNQKVKKAKVTTVQGTEMVLKADTVCIHGDGEHALQFARFIHECLQQEHIHIQAFR